MNDGVRLLYFGSRDWIDVPDRWSLREAHRYVRERAEVPLSGRRWRCIRRRMALDVAEHGHLVIVEGEADGADVLSRLVADVLGQAHDPYPVDTAIDGPWPAAGHRRNARMHRDGRPVAARGFVTGFRGTALSRGSAGMLEILRRAGVSVIVHRDDGIEVDAADVARASRR